MAEHYFSEKQKSSFSLIEISEVLRNREFTFYSSGGVFSKKKVDNGTKLLVNSCLMEDGWRVLDLGCGYGPVGVAIGVFFPKCSIMMTDINERALQLARKNVQKYNLKNITVRKSEGFAKIKATFDTILLNPPQTAGKKVCEQMIAESVHHLAPGGVFQMVARHSKGGKSLSAYLEEIYGNCETIARGSGYRIYVGTKQE